MFGKMLRFRPVALLLAILIGILFAGAASAHEVEVTRSDPSSGAVLEQSPATVRAWFDEELQTGPSTLVVLDANGQQVDNRDGGVDLDDPAHASMAVSLPALPDGSYSVSWYVVLLDGDASEGQFTFFVGEKPASAVAAVSQPSAPEAPGASAAPAGERPGLPMLWIALGLGLLVVAVVLGMVILRGRAPKEA
jgi:copper transport protein